MNWLDAVLVIVLLAGALFGYKSGLVWQVIRLLSWIVAFWLAGRHHADVGRGIGSVLHVGVPSWLAYLVLLTLLLLVFYAVAHLARSLVDAIHLKMLDRLVGALLGALKVAAIGSVVVVYIHLFAEPDTLLQRGVAGSYLASRLITVLETLFT